MCYEFRKYLVNVYYYVFPKNIEFFLNGINNISYFHFLYFLGMDSWEINYSPPTPPLEKVLPEAVHENLNEYDFFPDV